MKGVKKAFLPMLVLVTALTIGSMCVAPANAVGYYWGSTFGGPIAVIAIVAAIIAIILRYSLPSKD